VLKTRSLALLAVVATLAFFITGFFAAWAVGVNDLSFNVCHVEPEPLHCVVLEGLSAYLMIATLFSLLTVISVWIAVAARTIGAIRLRYPSLPIDPGGRCASSDVRELGHMDASSLSFEPAGARDDVDDQRAVSAVQVELAALGEHTHVDEHATTSCLRDLQRAAALSMARFSV
jgi:hypothetical protein